MEPRESRRLGRRCDSTYHPCTIHLPSMYLSITCPICSMDSFQICDEASTPAYELVCLRAHICWNPWMPFIWREAERICQLSQRCGECWKMKFRRHVVLVLAMPLSFLPSMPLLKLLQKTVRPCPTILTGHDWPIWPPCFGGFSLAHDFSRSPGRN